MGRPKRESPDLKLPLSPKTWTLVRFHQPDSPSTDDLVCSRFCCTQEPKSAPSYTAETDPESHSGDRAPSCRAALGFSTVFRVCAQHCLSQLHRELLALLLSIYARARPVRHWQIRTAVHQWANLGLPSSRKAPLGPLTCLLHSPFVRC
jgi:hypothetical protein